MLYANSSRCDALGWYWVVVPTVAIALIILAAMYRKADSLKAMAMSYSAESQAKGRHLVQLYQQWEIEASSIKVTSILGEGQYGAVYRGTYNSMEVAIKKLKTHGLPYEYYAELKESFETEASLMLQFNHPNVVFFYGAGYEVPEGEEHGIPFVVTELAGRGSLAHVLDDKTGPDQIDWAQKLQFALDAATGMQFLHDKDVMHRDLKSANLLVATDFTVKVTGVSPAPLCHPLARLRKRCPCPLARNVLKPARSPTLTCARALSLSLTHTHTRARACALEPKILAPRVW